MWDTCAGIDVWAHRSVVDPCIGKSINTRDVIVPAKKLSSFVRFVRLSSFCSFASSFFYFLKTNKTNEELFLLKKDEQSERRNIYIENRTNEQKNTINRKTKRTNNYF